MLHSAGSQVLNGWNAFSAATTGASVPLSDCDFFSVNLSGTWVGTMKWMASLDNVNWFDMALQNANGAVTPAVSLTSTGTDKNGNYFASAGSGLLYVRVVTSAWTSGIAYVYTTKHRGTYVSGQDFWDTAMPFTRDAVFAIDASRSSVGETVVVNAGSGGTVLNATLGSTGGADSNDPLLLPWTGTNYLYLPGVTGNYASTPDAAPLDILGDIEIVVRVALDDWTPTTSPCVISKSGVADPDRGWQLNINSDGTFQLAWYPLGTSASGKFKSSTVAAPVTDGATLWIKATLDIDNGATQNDVRFYTAPDQATEPSSWTQLGTTVTTAGTTSLPNNPAVLALGLTGSAPLAGRIYRGIVRDGIGGTTVFDANFTTGITSGAQATFTESSSNAATVTINRATAGRKSVAVTRPVWLLGTDDYMEVADNALLNMDATQSFTVLAVVRQWDTPTSSGRWVTKGQGATARWGLITSGATLQSFGFVNDGVNPANTSITPFVAGSLITPTMTVDRTAQLQTLYSNGLTSSTSTSLVGSLINTQGLTIGTPGDKTTFQDFELLAVAIFRRALSAAEIATINTYYGTA